MAIKNNDMQVEVVKDEPKQEETFDFGFDAEYTEFEGYTSISGNEQVEVSNFDGYSMSDLEIGQTITGYPEVTIFANADKNDNGEYIKKYQNVRIRVIDQDITTGEGEFVDFYANIPRRDENGFVENLNKYFEFYRGGFDLCFSFMRFLNETNVVDENGEINRIKKVNIDNVCKFIDKKEWIEIKVIKGANEEYNSFIILNMR